MNGYTLNKKKKKNAKVIWLFIISLIFVGIATSIAVVGCNYIGNRNFKETFYNVSSLKVNNCIRVIQISDLHNCNFGKNNAKLISRVKKLNPDIETLFLTTRAENMYLSSSMVKQIASMGGDITDFIPAIIHDDIVSRLSSKE